MVELHEHGTTKVTKDVIFKEDVPPKRNIKQTSKDNGQTNLNKSMSSF